MSLSATFHSSAVSAATQASEPIVFAQPAQMRKALQPAAMALTGHAKRVGALAVDISALHPTVSSSQPQGSLAEKPKTTDNWIAPRLALSLFPDVQVRASALRMEQDAFGNMTWVGRVEGTKEGIVLLTTKGDTLVGRVDIGFDQYLLTGNTKNGYWATEIDPASYARMGDAEMYPTGDAIDFHSAGFHAVTQGASAGHTIDVLILTSTAARARMGGMDPSPFVAALVGDANQSFYNSNVDGAVRVVGYGLIPGTCGPPASGFCMREESGWDAYDEFTYIRNAMTGVAGPSNYYYSELSAVTSIRDQYHADVVALFVDGTRISNGPCGISWLMRDNLTQQAENSDFVYMVLNTECAIGDRTFTHELGHILSGRHDDMTGLKNEDCSGTNPPPGCSDTNPYTTDVGYTEPSHFHTIMGSRGVQGGMQCDPFVGCARINRWSSPVQTYMGYPLGQPSFLVHTTSYSNDMVYTLNVHDTVGIVAGYRTPTGLAVPGAPTNLTHRYCQNMTQINWHAASGTVGWYEADFSSAAGYEGPMNSFSTHLSSSQTLSVRACNAAGCGQAAQTHVPATGPTCDPV